MEAETAEEARERHVAPLLAKLQDNAGDLIPVRPIEGDRFIEHPSGGVIFRVSPTCSLWFDSAAQYDEITEGVERERAPGRDPWAPAAVADYQAEVRRLRDEKTRAELGRDW